MSHSGVFRLQDPLYGRTTFSDFENTILSSPEFQRLRYIRMCNINSMLITGASEINRFEHSLGVMRLAQEWLSAFPHQGTRSDRDSIIAASLLHDVITGPFGHSLQYVLEDNAVDGGFSHEDVSHSSSSSYYQALTLGAHFAGRPFIIADALARIWPSISELIRGGGRFGPLISGNIDIDNIDNVFRLAYHVGVADHSDAEVAIKLVRDLLPLDGRLSISELSVPFIQRWQKVRHDLYELLLLDWAEFSAKAMLTVATEMAIAAHLVGSEHWKLTDLEFLYFLEKKSSGEHQQIGELLRRLRCGDLYDPVALLSSTSVQAYKSLSTLDAKNSLAWALSGWAKKNVGFKSPLIVHYILDHGKTDRAIEVCMRDKGNIVTLGADSDRLLIGVFSSRPIEKAGARSGLHAEILRALDRLGLAQVKRLSDPLAEGTLHTPYAPRQYNLL